MKKFLGLLFFMYPWIWLTALAAFAFRTKSLLGIWPRPSHPDPKLLPFEMHHAFLWAGFYLVLCVGLIDLLSYAKTSNLRLKHASRTRWIPTVGWAFVVSMIYAPPLHGNWIAWFLD